MNRSEILDTAKAYVTVDRAKANPAHADNWVDGCGYLACGGEIADKENDAQAKMLAAVRGEAL